MQAARSSQKSKLKRAESFSIIVFIPMGPKLESYEVLLCLVWIYWNGLYQRPMNHIPCFESVFLFVLIVFELVREFTQEF